MGRAFKWRKSRRSSDTGANCVEVARAERVLIRDSKDRTGPVLSFGDRDWTSFVDAVKAARYGS